MNYKLFFMSFLITLGAIAFAFDILRYIILDDYLTHFSYYLLTLFDKIYAAIVCTISLIKLYIIKPDTK